MLTQSDGDIVRRTTGRAVDAHRTAAVRHSRDSARALRASWSARASRFAPGKNDPARRVLTVSASAWVIRTPVKHRLGRRVPRTLVAKQRRCRLDLAPGRFSAFVVPVLRGRPDPTSSPNTGAAQWSVEGLTHRAIAVSVAASGPLARRRQCLAVARQISPRAEAGRKAGGAIPRVAFGPCDPPSCE